MFEVDLELSREISRFVDEYHIDDTYDDRHRITEAIQDRHDLKIKEKEVNCSEYIEFSLKKKYWVEWKIIRRQKWDIETQTLL